MRGLVIKNTGSWYSVRTDDGRTIESKLKGNFRLKDIRSTNPVSVGDRVDIEINNEGTAFITEIEERKNYIIRRASNLSKQSHIIAANLDQAMLIVTVNYPITTTVFIDRFLATAEAYRVPVKLVFNKIDRYNADDREYMEALILLYTSIGYPCSKICARKEDGLDELRAENGFELLESGAQRRLGDETRLRGAGEIELLCERDQILQLFERWQGGHMGRIGYRYYRL